MNRAELIIARLTEENDLQRASIQELSKQVAKMQKVVDAAKDIELNLHNIKFEKQETFRFYQLLRQKVLRRALAELERNTEPFKPSSYKDSAY